MGKKPGLGERSCPKCKETIKADALICKHCRTEFTKEEVAAARKDQNMVAGFGCLAILFLIGFCTINGDSADKTASVPEKPTSSAKGDAVNFYKNVVSAIASCDSAGKDVASAGAASDLVSLYQAANRMSSSCLRTSTDIRKIEVPTAVGKEAYSKLTETREVCENAYLAKWSAANKMKEVLDDGGIGRVAELKDQTEMMQAGTLLCATGLVGQAMQLGASNADLGVDAGTER